MILTVLLHAQTRTWLVYHFNKKTFLDGYLIYLSNQKFKLLTEKGNLLYTDLISKINNKKLID